MKKNALLSLLITAITFINAQQPGVGILPIIYKSLTCYSHCGKVDTVCIIKSTAGLSLSKDTAWTTDVDEIKEIGGVVIRSLIARPFRKGEPTDTAYTLRPIFLFRNQDEADTYQPYFMYSTNIVVTDIREQQYQTFIPISAGDKSNMLVSPGYVDMRLQELRFASLGIIR
jgi:hypothetical protein